MQDKAIGVFDSGVGGLTCIKELVKLLPFEDIVYLGDTKRMPYGQNTKETLIEYTQADVDFLKRRGVKMIAAACGTVSSNVSIAELSRVEVSYIDVIQPTVNKALSKTKNNKIAILATQATVKSEVFPKRLKELNKDIECLSIACPLFVTLIEEGHTDDEIIKNTAKEYLKDIKTLAVDTIILGCTHFPIISKVIQDIVGDDIILIDAGKEAAIEIKTYLLENDLTTTKKTNPQRDFYTTSNPLLFDEIAKIFLGSDVVVKSQLIDIKD